MPEIIALSCPVCGAPLAPGAEKCEYCGSYIVIKTDLPKLDRHNLNQALIQENIAKFRARIRSDQYDEEAHYGLGLAYYSLGLINDAIEELTQAARLMPENPNIQSQLAVALYDAWKAGDASAETKLNQRITSTLLLDPDNVEASILKIEVLIYKKQHREAVRALEELIRHDNSAAKEKLTSHLQDLGTEYLESAQWDEAVWCWQTLSPIDRGAASNLALQFMSLNAQLAPKEYKKLRVTSAPTSLPKSTTRASTSNQSMAKRVVILILSIVVAGFVGLLAMGVIVTVGNDASQEASGIRTLIAFLSFLAVVIAVPTWYWRRSNPNREERQISLQAPILQSSGTSSSTAFVDHAKTFAAADKTLEKIKIHEKFLAAQQVAQKR